MRASQDRPEAGRIVDRRPVCNGNTETWGQTFSRESIIAWLAGLAVPTTVGGTT